MFKKIITSTLAASLSLSLFGVASTSASAEPSAETMSVQAQSVTYGPYSFGSKSTKLDLDGGVDVRIFIYNPAPRQLVYFTVYANDGKQVVVKMPMRATGPGGAVYQSTVGFGSFHGSGYQVSITAPDGVKGTFSVTPV
ncbi:hypothetical protein [Paenibacillus bovis]|uniref:Uncharacterized protein n=1 Tax=Paenibacillus bovis TaxID=1616788 RepID=A0A1X9T472_9BACL|nr:hypothetical protein [Paenibacillus bovis]ARR10694.1 hypothetical protein AR543_p0086 [Paenibacillus bovis]